MATPQGATTPCLSISQPLFVDKVALGLDSFESLGQNWDKVPRQSMTETQKPAVQAGFWMGRVGLEPTPYGL